MKKQKFYTLFGGILVLLFCLGSILIVKNQYQTLTSVQHYLQTTLSSSENQPKSYIFDLGSVPPLIESFETTVNSKLALILLPSEYKELINLIAPHTDEIKEITKNLLAKDQKWLILFQNSDEIRATGGFIGSYAIVDIKSGKIVEITTEDIYDADGQFSGYVSPPSGVEEYLSSGNGLRLPDANWHPDTAVSAQQILQFFALGNKQNIAGVVFVNIEFAEKLLEFTGDIELIDYNTIVTSDNISEVLRSRRADFFPGSIQKKHMLSQLLTQVRLKLMTVNPTELANLVKIISEQLELHNLQIYATDSHIDKIFQENELRQSLPQSELSNYLYLIESNVGINKANKKIEREVVLTIEEEKARIVVKYTNNNTPPQLSKLSKLVENELIEKESSRSAVSAESHLAYVNYQRVIVPQTWQLESIYYQGEPVTKVTNETVPEFSNLQQVNTLLTLEEGKTGTLEILFSSPTHVEKTFFIQHQPGLPPTKYTIEYNNQTIEETITSDTEITIE